MAEEEEAIRDLRATAEAKRQKDVLVISAEAEAREKVVKDIAIAEASEEAAKYSIREQMARADADIAAAWRVGLEGIASGVDRSEGETT